MSLLMMGFILVMTIVVILGVGSMFKSHYDHKERMKKIKYGLVEVESPPTT